MGNYRFRLSDMMPNAWFYKLREMSRGRRGQSIPHSMKNRSHPKIAATTGPKPFPQAPPQLKQAHLHNRRSCYFSTRGETEQRSPCSPIHHKASDTHFPVQPPRKSKRRSRRKPIKHSTNLVSSSVSAGCSCRVSESKSLPENHDDYTDDDLHKPIIADHLEFNDIESWSRLCSCRLTSSATDIIIDMAGSKSKSKSSFSRTLDQFEDFKSTSELELPPILTKPAMKEEQSLKVHAKFPATKEQSKGTPRKSPPELHRLRLRANSPRVVSKRVPTCRARKSSATMGKQQKGGLSDYFAVMKLSSDPQREFRDSMVEMIVENNIRASKDLEDLLACYLSLNANEYHDVIIKVFEQIWFDLTDIRL